jgi:hypothetical protein
MPVGPISNSLEPRQTICNQTHDIDHHLKFSLSTKYNNVFYINNAQNRIFQVVGKEFVSE